MPKGFLKLFTYSRNTMSGYINNIVDEHLKKYSPEIMKLYKDKES